MLAVIKYACRLSNDDSRRLGRIYAKQIKAGALVLDECCSLELVADASQIQSVAIRTSGQLPPEENEHIRIDINKPKTPKPKEKK